MLFRSHGESAQRDRAEVDRRRTDEHGTEMENFAVRWQTAKALESLPSAADGKGLPLAT